MIKYQHQQANGVRDRPGYARIRLWDPRPHRGRLLFEEWLPATLEHIIMDGTYKEYHVRLHRPLGAFGDVWKVNELDWDPTGSGPAYAAFDPCI
jgi:hypothetical protein